MDFAKGTSTPAGQDSPLTAAVKRKPIDSPAVASDEAKKLKKDSDDADKVAASKGKFATDDNWTN